MEYISIRETAAKWGLTTRMVSYHCASGRVKGAQKIGNMWVVPKDAEKPEDWRKGSRKKLSPEGERIEGQESSKARGK